MFEKKTDPNSNNLNKSDFINTLEGESEESKELRLLKYPFSNFNADWVIRPREAMQYLSRAVEKFKIKTIEKEKKIEEKQQMMLGKKTK